MFYNFYNLIFEKKKIFHLKTSKNNFFSIFCIFNTILSLCICKSLFTQIINHHPSVPNIRCFIFSPSGVFTSSASSTRRYFITLEKLGTTAHRDRSASSFIFLSTPTNKTPVYTFPCAIFAKRLGPETEIIRADVATCDCFTAQADAAQEI